MGEGRGKESGTRVYGVRLGTTTRTKDSGKPGVATVYMIKPGVSKRQKTLNYGLEWLIFREPTGPVCSVGSGGTEKVQKKIERKREGNKRKVLPSTHPTWLPQFLLFILVTVNI